MSLKAEGIEKSRKHHARTCPWPCRSHHGCGRQVQELRFCYKALPTLVDLASSKQEDEHKKTRSRAKNFKQARLIDGNPCINFISNDL
ncbi:hypothetical protein QL285_050413 [Trifolium repens]|nr:hypothetical protein QL285_050413 [Trifolium repens]